MREILIACEFSQIVTMEFRKIGYSAFSCDIIPTIGNPEWHIVGDAIKVLYSRPWGLVIAHPPCTYLSKVGAAFMNDPGRAELRQRAARFFMEFYDYKDCPVVIENPVPLKCAGLPQYDQIIDPTQFGSQWHKKTCLWLKGVPPLLPTNCYNPWGKSFHDSRSGGRNRSMFFPEVAREMANQWSKYVKEGVKCGK